MLYDPRSVMDIYGHIWPYIVLLLRSEAAKSTWPWIQRQVRSFLDTVHPECKALQLKIGMAHICPYMGHTWPYEGHLQTPGKKKNVKKNVPEMARYIRSPYPSGTLFRGWRF